MDKDVKELCLLNLNLYRCISPKIDTNRVVLTDKQLLHMVDKHPEAYNEVLLEMKETIANPDYIIEDKKHNETGLVIKKIFSDKITKEHSFIVLRVCTDSKNGEFANSVISGWKISDRRLQSYLRNETILYKRE